MSCGCDIEHQIINQTAGEEDYLWPTRVTELKGNDITADVVTASVGTRNSAGTFVPVVNPHRLTIGTILAGDFKRANPTVVVTVSNSTVLYWVEVELFIGATGISDLTPGIDYYPRVKLADTPATVIRRGQVFSLI